MPPHDYVEVHYHKTLTCEDAHAKEDNLRKIPIRLKIYFFSTMKFAQIDNPPPPRNVASFTLTQLFYGIIEINCFVKERQENLICQSTYNVL